LRSLQAREITDANRRQLQLQGSLRRATAAAATATATAPGSWPSASFVLLSGRAVASMASVGQSGLFLSG